MTIALCQTENQQPIAGEFELQRVKAVLLAMISMADGKVLDIEDLVSQAMIDQLEQCDLNHLKHVYQKISLGHETPSSLDELANVINTAPLHEQLFLVRMMATVAACDGTVHPREQELISELLTRLRLHGSQAAAQALVEAERA